MSPRHPQLLQILRDRSLRRGRFVLASGKVSDYYIDGKMTSFDPAGSAAIVDAIFAELAQIPYDAIGGMDMGGTPIVGAVANRSFHIGKPVPTFVVRKDVKAHGTMKRIEGPIPPAPCNVVIIEDVVTTGDSMFKAIDAVTEYGAKVVLAITVLDRAAGATESMAARNIPYRPLCTLAELGLAPMVG
jgi:orotate phosphoribosyltransferase